MACEHKTAVGTWKPNLRACASGARRFRWREVRQDESGSALIEFAVSVGALMTLVFTLMEMCIVFYTYGMISDAARSGTRYAIVHGSTCTTASNTSCTATAAQINSYVQGLNYPNIGGATPQVSTTWPGTGNSNAPGYPVQVQVTYTFPIALPLVPKNSLTLKVSSEMYILQ
jgi:Flp pilus assembly protein TadG